MKNAKSTMLSVKNLSIGYKSRHVAENINFSIKKGELCAIIGVNGIGKSTLIRTLARLQSKLGGSIAIQQRDIATLSPQELAKELALVLTEPIASRNLTVQELIALGRQPHTNWLGTLGKNDVAVVQKSLGLFGLESLKQRKCHELSDGQQQRVLIARTVAQETPMIFLDEPATHLDLHHKVQIFRLLQALAHEHEKSIIFTTHDIGMAIQLCDTILILDGDTNPFGAPCELIAQGHFERLFPKDTVVFDAKSGSFKITK